jgi:predicted metal-dependent HD superfamily phosphohydrolase
LSKSEEQAFLRDVLTIALSRYCQDEVLREAAWTDIYSQYSSTGRFYHNLDHLFQLLKSLEKFSPEFITDDAVIFAVFYHDFIYNPLKSDNEEKSARYALRELRRFSISEEVLADVSLLILATKKHEQAADERTNAFIDADLSILGGEPEQYIKYSQLIRKEYSLVPDLIYKPGRRKVISYFLEMPFIYKTIRFRAELEYKARKNLREELGTLQ